MIMLLVTWLAFQSLNTPSIRLEVFFFFRFMLFFYLLGYSQETVHQAGLLSVNATDLYLACPWFESSPNHRRS
jgi:hypothetical protein